jgi:hypothetical protein
MDAILMFWNWKPGYKDLINPRIACFEAAYNEPRGIPDHDAVVEFRLQLSSTIRMTYPLNPGEQRTSGSQTNFGLQEDSAEPGGLLVMLVVLAFV